MDMRCAFRAARRCAARCENAVRTPVSAVEFMSAGSRRIAREAGLRHVFTGNIHDSEGQGTYCHGCGALLIGRDWYDITAWTLTSEGRCRACGTRCAGVFEAAPGRWGRRRVPVTVREAGANRRARSTAVAAGCAGTSHSERSW